MINTHFTDIRAKILNQISDAREEVLVAVYWFTNEELFCALIEKLKEGVNVRLIIHNDFINNRDEGLEFNRFIKEGGVLYFSSNQNPMHNKFCIVDRKCLINGSYNWTYYAEQKNHENVIIIKDEMEVVNSFREEFIRLEGLSLSVDEIEQISKFEIGINNELNHNEYLAQDLLFKAKVEGSPLLVEKAFELAPDNVVIQELAKELKLIDQRLLRYNIGISIVNNRVKLLARKGDSVPATYSTIIRTNKDNQAIGKCNLVYGNDYKADKNRILISFEINNIPPLPKGEGQIKYSLSIDKDGSAIVEQLCLNNGEKSFKKFKELDLVD